MASSKPRVTFVSFCNGGIPEDVNAETPAEIATEMKLGLENVKLYVNESLVQANHALRDKDMVSFQKAKVESGQLT